MKTILVIIISALTCSAFGQMKVSGTVTDIKGEPVPGANVYLADTYDGATTDHEGRFEFTSPEKGVALLIVTFIGYKEFRREVLLEGKPIIIEARLIEEINELEAVTITVGVFTASDESRRTIFNPTDIATTAGATADIAGALNTLPGTQKVGENGRLFVRGGDGHEVRTFIDGMAVFNPYSATAPNTPTRGRFLPFMFKGTSFSTGGYSAEYGQALSSALILDSKDKEEITRTDIGILSAGVDLTRVQAWERTSLAGKIEYTNIRPYYHLIDQEIDWKNPPVSVAGHLVFRQQVLKDGLLKVYGNINHSRLSLFNHDIDNPSQRYLYDLSNDYRYVNATYKNPLNENWIVRGGVSLTYVQDHKIIEDVSLTDTEKALHVKAVFEGSLSERIELKTGIETITRRYDQHTLMNDLTGSMAGFHEHLTAAFIESDVYGSNRFITRGGIRFEYNSLLHEVFVDPRLSLAHKTGKNGSVSVAYGKFRQSPVEHLLLKNNELEPERADHYIASYQVINDDRTFRVETYYKKYDNLVKVYEEEELTNDGEGEASGIEFFWRDKRTFKNTDYWISYSWLDTKRNYLHFPYKATPSFVSNHNFSIVCKYFLTPLKTQLGATYSFASGRPYNDPNKTIFNDGKTPAYHDLSVNAAWLPKSWLIVYFSVTNVTGRDNIFGYEFSSVPNEDGFYSGRPVRQPARRFFFAGIFITLSKEKSVNLLPAL